MTKDEEIKEYLLSNDPDFRRLVEQHHAYEVELRRIHDQQHVTEPDRVEETTLKKKKLYLKDQMSRKIHEYRRNQPSHPQA